jgi:hypothetical protein
MAPVSQVPPTNKQTNCHSPTAHSSLHGAIIGWSIMDHKFLTTLAIDQSDLWVDLFVL